MSSHIGAPQFGRGNTPSAPKPQPYKKKLPNGAVPRLEDQPAGIFGDMELTKVFAGERFTQPECGDFFVEVVFNDPHGNDRRFWGSALCIPIVELQKINGYWVVGELKKQLRNAGIEYLLTQKSFSHRFLRGGASSAEVRVLFEHVNGVSVEISINPKDLPSGMNVPEWVDKLQHSRIGKTARDHASGYASRNKGNHRKRDAECQDRAQGNNKK